jgi:hypothetical protein
MSTYTLQGIAMCSKNMNEWEVNPTLKRKEITLKKFSDKGIG